MTQQHALGVHGSKTDGRTRTRLLSFAWPKPGEEHDRTWHTREWRATVKPRPLTEPYGITLNKILTQDAKLCGYPDMKTKSITRHASHKLVRRLTELHEAQLKGEIDNLFSKQ